MIFILSFLFLTVEGSFLSWREIWNLSPKDSVPSATLSTDDVFLIDDEIVNKKLLEDDYSFHDDYYSDDDLLPGLVDDYYGEDDDEWDFYQSYAPLIVKHLRTNEHRSLSALQEDVSSHPVSWVLLSLSIGVFVVLLATLTLRPRDMRPSLDEDKSVKVND
jgi:hypothetical protein